jgi:hypothetical protein
LGDRTPACPPPRNGEAPRHPRVAAPAPSIFRSHFFDGSDRCNGYRACASIHRVRPGTPAGRGPTHARCSDRVPRALDLSFPLPALPVGRPSSTASPSDRTDGRAPRAVSSSTTAGRIASDAPSDPDSQPSSHRRGKHRTREGNDDPRPAVALGWERRP